MRAVALMLLMGCSAVEEDVRDSPVVAPWPEPVQDVLLIEGDITWHVDFDAEAEQAGKTDCSYTRRYRAVEDRSRPWTCRSCNAVLRADVEMVAGREDCYTQVTESDVNPVEWVGYSAGSWWRSTRENTSLRRSASTSIQGSGFTTSSVSNGRSYDGHDLVFTGEGQMQTGRAEGDLLDGLTPPQVSACGWERAVIETYTGGTTLREGGTLPDAYLPDVCEEGTRLHFQQGKFQVVAFVAADSTDADSFLDGIDASVGALAEQEIELEVVVLLAEFADDRFSSGLPSLASFAKQHGLSGPVLDHRGYGPTVLGGGDAVVWPVVAVVDPDLEVLSIQREGFEGWPAVLETIEAATRRE
ncbi:MAG: hypothetical protein KC912_05220 [Proteobacteria bacterium]|nr:hypothetical protein [Pseudomonadota bacterium]